MKNELFTEVCYHVCNKFGEELCGDHIEEVIQDDNSRVLVLADGMGSGVKASILSTLTAKIISTMLANNMTLEDCVETIVSTLPVNKDVGVAYSTFTIIRIYDNKEAQIIRFDNPTVLVVRDGKCIEFNGEKQIIAGRKIYKTICKLQENDVFIGFSDGALYASNNDRFDMSWDISAIAEFVETIYEEGESANYYTSMLLDEILRLYGDKPKDDVSVFTVRIRRRSQVNVLIGPPRNPKDVPLMMSTFFAKEGKKVICGGTTSTLAGEFLGKPVKQGTDSLDPSIPPRGYIEGVDLVTEGVITLSRVVAYAKNYLKDSEGFDTWSGDRDAAFVMARMLFEEATDIRFTIGTAINPAHQLPKSVVGYNVKQKLIEELEEALKKMGKTVKLRYY